MNCPSCKGSGKQTIRAKTYLGPGKWKNEPPVEIECLNCHGTGEVNAKEQRAREKAWKEFWCDCGNPSGETSYYRHGSAHGYTCADCGRVLQTG